jgi:hypothetical protein
LSAIDAMVRGILEGGREHCFAWSQGIAIASNYGQSSSADAAPTRFALAARNFWAVDPSRRAGEACDFFEIHVARSKRLTARSWRAFTQRLARCEALPRHGRQHRRYCDMNASWEEA